MGIANRVEHVMTFKILTDDVHKIIYYSNIISAEDPDTTNLRLYLFYGKKPLNKFIRSESDNNQYYTMMIMKLEDMIGRTFLDQPRDDGEIHQATIIKVILNHDKNLESNHERIKFILSFNDDQYAYIYVYNNIIRHIEKYNNDPDIWKFKHITAH